MKTWLIAALVVMSAPTYAAEDIAKTFVAEAVGNSVTIYSKSSKPRRCDVNVDFSVMQDGKRVEGISRCFETDIAAGDHVKVCDFTHPKVVEPKIEGPVKGQCK